jgi:hypothetical protein
MVTRLIETLKFGAWGIHNAIRVIKWEEVGKTLHFVAENQCIIDLHGVTRTEITVFENNFVNSLKSAKCGKKYC